MAAIEVRDLRKTFVRRVSAGRLRRTKVDVEAVCGVDLVVEPGELIGYIGQNGAGKSTTIKMLTGILAPTSGHVRVAGLDPVQDRVALARRIGVVFGQRSQLWWDLPLGQSFDLLHHVYRTTAADHRANLADLCERLGATDLLAVPVRQLSLGQRMRGELVASLLHRPEVVFLDEPTVGLDVVSKHAVRQALADLQQDRGTTIVLTTHDLADVERLCKRLVIIDSGRVVWDGALENLVSRYGGERTMVVDLDETVPPLQVAGVHCERVDGPRQWLRFGVGTSAAEVLAAVSAQASVRDLTIEEPQIEEIVRRIYAG